MEVLMATRPHDVTDLYLAPVALAVDARIEELGQLDKDELVYEVALDADSPDFTRRMREDGLIRTVTHLIDDHGWEFSWDPRGLRLTHDAHSLVLGIPAVFHEYLEYSPGRDAMGAASLAGLRPGVVVFGCLLSGRQREEGDEAPDRGHAGPDGQATGARLLRRRAMGFAAHDQHRAMRVVDAVLADRAEQRVGDAPVAAAADHEQVCVGRGLQQDLVRVAIHHPCGDSLAIGRLDFIADHGVQGLACVLLEAAHFVHVDRCPGGGPQDHRNLPGHDGLHHAAGEHGVPDRPAEGCPRRRRTIDSDHDLRAAR